MGAFFDSFGQIITFGLVTLLVFGTALCAVFAKSLVHSAFALFFTLLGMSGYYFLLGADFIGIVQVILYVGGIMVLLLFGVLLTNRSIDRLSISGRASYLAAGLAGGAIFILLVVAVLSPGVWGSVTPVVPEETALTIGKRLLSDYLLVFEFSSVTLLAALIGAAYLVRKRDS